MSYRDAEFEELRSKFNDINAQMAQEIDRYLGMRAKVMEYQEKNKVVDPKVLTPMVHELINQYDFIFPALDITIRNAKLAKQIIKQFKADNKKDNK